ncbi:MAG: hypothetical protein JWM80_4290 [Cyanobacteria bacterium RYN_339]|nr:hypothetical protein [Cyanobacteria bacterium RYN_339]
MVRSSLPLLAAFTLAACAPTGLGVVTKPKASPARVDATTTASAAPAAANLLLRPGTPVRVVKGVLALDASYVTASKAGSLISGNGSAVLGMGGLITNDGGSLVGNDGVTIVAQGAGNVIAPNGGSVIAPNGGTVISGNGSAVIGGNGSSIVSPNGGTIVSPNGGTYRLAATTPAMVPAAGMLLQAVRLGVDQPIALGTDAQGHPVYAVYTNAGGHFELYLPATETGNLHLRAVAPNLDARLVYDHVGSPAEGADVAIDEDSAQASRYLLGAFRGKLAAILAAPNIDDPAFRTELFKDTHITPEVANFVWPVAHQFIDRVKAAGVPPARYPEAAGHAAEALLRVVKLEDILVDRANTDYKVGPANETSLEALKAVFKLTREQVAALGTPDQVEAYFAKQDYLIAANAARPGLPPYKIRKSSDIGDFLVERYFSNVKAADTNGAGPVFFSLHPGVTENHELSVLDHLYAAASGIGLQLAFAFVQDEAAQAAVFAAIDAMGKAKP